jgi:hypothetical protein
MNSLGDLVRAHNEAMVQAYISEAKNQSIQTQNKKWAKVFKLADAVKAMGGAF